jgi:hypothetical protein
LDEARNSQRHPLSTQKRMQLAGLTQRLSPLLNGLLGLQAVASRRGVGDADEHFHTEPSQPNSMYSPYFGQDFLDLRTLAIKAGA